MNWSRLLLASVVPLAVVGPVASWLWARKHFDGGKVAAILILLVFSMAFSAIEFVDCDRTRLACIQDGLKSACLSMAEGPDDSVRVGAYGIVGMAQIGLVFLASDIVEKRRRNDDFDPAWRR